MEFVLDMNKLREFISRCQWKWARTMPTVPHEYIFRGRCALTDEEYYYFLRAQLECGRVEWWGKGKRPYLYIDGYKYWTMGDFCEENKTMNRQKLFDEFDLYEWPIPRIYTNQEMDIMAKTIISSFKGEKVFEAGFGNGDFVKFSNIKPDMYYGIDSSKKAVKLFREKMYGFYRRCATQSFEEAINKWLSADSVVVALFGSPSYFMTQYLSKLGESGLDYCLMFYREDYSPKEFDDMHHFTYDKGQLMRLFPGCNIYNHKNFITVSSKKLIWQQPTIENELFPV